MHGGIRASPEQLLKALDGELSRINRRLLEDSLEEYRFYSQKPKLIEEDIMAFIMTHFPDEFDLLIEIHGVKQHSAAVILAEIGPTIEAFKTAGHLASRAGMSPRSYESAGIKKSSRTTRGNKCRKTILVSCGGIIGRSTAPAFSALYQRVSSRGSKMKAVVACGHKLLRIIYKILSCQIHYDKEKALGLHQQY